MHPFRRALHRFERGSVPRGICVLVLKYAQRAFDDRLPRSVTEVRPCDAPAIAFEPSDSMVIVAVYWFGVSGYEGIVGPVWKALCANAQAILEIGGNVGLFTVIGGLAAPGSYAVLEPIPRNADVLRANLLRNGVGDRVEVLQAAAVAGDVGRDVHLNVPPEHNAMTVGAHLVEGVEVTGRSTSEMLLVRGLPARDLFAGRDLIKIDAEGIEAQLLLSARDIIVANRPILLIEVLPEAVRLGEVIRALATEIGYTITVLPEYGTDVPVVVDTDAFTSKVPARHRSKDIVLSIGALPALPASRRKRRAT